MLDLWRERRFRRLLNLIDHLPPDSYYWQGLSNNVEHARMMAEMRKGSEEKEFRPPQATWTAEVSVLADVINEVRRLCYLTEVKMNPKKSPTPPKPYPRPFTAAEVVREERKHAVHDKIARAMLRDRYKPS